MKIRLLKVSFLYVLITGPYKTADIESQLVHCAHGPREMHVVIVDEL